MAPTATFADYTAIIRETDPDHLASSDSEDSDPSTSDGPSPTPLKANANEQNGASPSPAAANTFESTGQPIAPPAAAKLIRGKAQRYDYVDVTEVQIFGDRTFRTITSILARKGTEKVEQFSEYSLMLLRIHNNERKEVERFLRCNSATLQKAIRDIVKISNTCNLYGDPIILKPPYRDLFYHRDALEKAAEDTSRDQVTRKELGLVKVFIEEHISELIQEYERLVAVGKINFRLLWCLYPPGHLCVLHNQHETREGVIVESSQLDREDRQQFNVFYIQMAFDGTSWGVKKGYVAIKLNSETVDISNLTLVPIEFLNVDDIELFQDELVTRGKKYASLVSQSEGDTHWHYKGRMISEEVDVRSVHIDSRVMLDRQAYWAHYPDDRVRLDWKPRYSDLEDSRRTGKSLLSKCLIGTGSSEATQRTSGEQGDSLSMADNRHYSYLESLSGDFSDEDDPYQYRQRRRRNQDLRATKGLKPHSTDIIDSLAANEDYMCCPAVTEAYSLLEKIWGIVRVEGIDKIDWRDSIFEFLQIEPDTKKLIQSLVERSASTQNQFDDKVPGKGRGLVFLLHGKPGLGKTLTAESIAEKSHRPLFAVTSGELSEDVERMESAVKQAFWLAERWQAVLLIDEADVFMFRRQANDSTGGMRNAMVTVFLKQVEYYKGFLFLTTNQVQDFDPAFDSRIHLKIHYPDLTAEKRLMIWRDLLKTIKTDDTFTESAYEQLGKMELNGREVKNVIRTANGYALALGRTNVSLEHIELVLKVNGMSKAFINRHVSGATDGN